MDIEMPIDRVSGLVSSEVSLPEVVWGLGADHGWHGPGRFDLLYRDEANAPEVPDHAERKKMSLEWWGEINPPASDILPDTRGIICLEMVQMNAYVRTEPESDRCIPGLVFGVLMQEHVDEGFWEAILYYINPVATETLEGYEGFVTFKDEKGQDEADHWEVEDGVFLGSLYQINNTDHSS